MAVLSVTVYYVYSIQYIYTYLTVAYSAFTVTMQKPSLWTVNSHSSYCRLTYSL